VVYLRIKKIKGKEYAYLVKSKLRKSGPRQKVKAYLGRVYRLSKEKGLDFWGSVNAEQESYLRLASKEKMLHDLIRFELLKHGFVNDPGTSNIWVKGSIRINIEKRRILNGTNSDCVLAINEGYLCGSKIKRLLNYERKNGVEESGYELAKLFVDSGIDIPQELFIAYYEKS
jgi:hypothetical protein